MQHACRVSPELLAQTQDGLSGGWDGGAAAGAVCRPIELFDKPVKTFSDTHDKNSVCHGKTNTLTYFLRSGGASDICILISCL